MTSNFFARNLPTSWERAILGTPWRSIPFMLTVLFNLAAIETLLQSCISYKKVLATDLLPIIGLSSITALLVMAGFLMWRIYRQTRYYASAGAENLNFTPLLKVSFDAFRLYVLFLGAVIIGLGFANIVIA